jgi:hypothetical protein
MFVSFPNPTSLSRHRRSRCLLTIPYSSAVWLHPDGAAPSRYRRELFRPALDRSHGEGIAACSDWRFEVNDLAHLLLLPRWTAAPAAGRKPRRPLQRPAIRGEGSHHSAALPQ